MDLPKRKQNRIPDYDYSLDGAYFVTLCTWNRARLFSMESAVGNGLRAVPEMSQASPRQNQIIHKWIAETVRKYPGLGIDLYVIMPDHVHMIVTIKERHIGRSLPDVMRFFKTMTTNEYIRGVKAGLLPEFDGKLWQKSYYEHVIRNQQDYNEVWEYIENNPRKWVMMKQGRE